MSYGIMAIGQNKSNSASAIYDDLARKEQQRNAENRQLKQAKQQEKTSVRATSLGTIGASAASSYAATGAVSLGPVGWAALIAWGAYELFD
ncbi:MAG: hypothetical protein ACK2UP_11255 [Candidatus Promineifilaceae bacterium]